RRGAPTRRIQRMYLQPVLRCKNPDCPLPAAAPLRLPYLNPPMAGDKTPNWPADNWEARVICHGCDHWYLYKKSDIAWAPFTHTSNEAGLDWWQVDQACGEPGCDSVTSWYFINTLGLAEQEVMEFVMRADPIPMCAMEHSLGISGIKERTAKQISS